MVSIIYAIARNTFIESVRQPIYFIIVALAGVFQVFTTWTAAFSMGYTESGEVSGDNQMLLSLSLGMALICGMLLAAFLATSVISKEIERKTVLTVVSKPVPRPAVVVGKYLGVVGAIVIAMITILMFMMLAIRHEVMATAADKVDGPVVVFGLLAIVIALGVGVWCNFFYGWVFSQTATLLLCPMMVLAWVLVLLVNKKWDFQGIDHDFKPQIAMASVAIVLAQVAMTAVATAASSRLGQVMTIVVCAGVLMMGLLSNHFLGRRAINNTAIARIESATPVLASRPDLDANGNEFDVVLELEPRRKIEPGMPFYYGTSPSGYMLATHPFKPYDGELREMQQLSDRSRPASLIVTSLEKKKVRILRVGADGAIASRLPRKGDYVFLKPTEYGAGYLATWMAVPNIQFFWLSDAVTQNQPIPGKHLGLLGAYTACLVGAFLSLAVILFQKREVG